MDDSLLSRRRTLRGVGTSVAAVGLAGCLDDLPLIGEDGPAPDVGPVPSDATLLATVDVARLLDDEQLRALVDESIPVSDVDTLLGRAEQRTGLDPDSLGTVTLFDEVTAESFVAGWGAIVDTDWSLGDVSDAAQAEGYTVSNDRISGNESISLQGSPVTVLSLSEDRLVVGSRDGTRAVASAEEDGETAGKAFRRAYGKSREGPIRFALDIGAMESVLVDLVAQEANLISEDVIGGLEYVSGAIYSTETAVGIEAKFRTANESATTQIKQFGEAIRGWATRYTDEEAVLDTLGDIEVTRSGTRVTMRLEGTPADLAPLTEPIGQWVTALVIREYLND